MSGIERDNTVDPSILYRKRPEQPLSTKPMKYKNLPNQTKIQLRRYEKLNDRLKKYKFTFCFIIKYSFLIYEIQLNLFDDVLII